MRLALYQPDIPQNTGTMLRLAACMDIPVDIIEPAGFPWSEARFRRAGMDYVQHVSIRRHDSFAAFEAERAAAGRRLVLMTTRGETPYPAFSFHAGDVLMLGRESLGVADEVHAAADARVRIPMRAGLRALNVAVAAAMVLGEALRQTGHLDALG